MRERFFACFREGDDFLEVLRSSDPNALSFRTYDGTDEGLVTLPYAAVYGLWQALEVWLDEKL